MAQFRETMWFKMGENLEPNVEGDEPSNVARPIEDRYAGKPSTEDTAAFGLHTGKTEAIRVDKAIRNVELDAVPMTKLVREMKKSSRAWIACACVAFVAVASYLAVYA